MSINIDDYLPQPRNWFEENIIYEGWGHAEFVDPFGWIEGLVKVTFDFLGEAQAEMEISKFHNEDDSDSSFSLKQLLSGQKAKDKQNPNIYMSSPSQKNKCKIFKVEGEDFNFEVISTIEFDFFHTLWINKTISFHFWQSRFTHKTSEKSKYWTMPLINFVSNSTTRFDGLNNHPLRLYSFPDIPEKKLTKEQNIITQNNRNAKNTLIIFQIRESLGFIEFLPTYNSSKKSLESDEVFYAVTALMNGETEEETITFENLNRLCPIQFLDILSLVTGTRVGAPWIEFRSEDGQILERLHIVQWTRQYTDGHVVINDNVHRGIGQLLTNAAESKHFMKPYVSDVIELLLLSSETRSYSVVDRFAYVCRAIDTLCDQLGFRKDLDLKNHLDLVYYKKLKEILTTAQKDIEVLENELEIDDIAKYLLARIKGGITHTKFEEGFGKYFIRLLESFGLNDTKILDRFFSLSPVVYHDRKNKKQIARKFGDVLTFYRGATIHNVSYFSSNDEHWNMLYVLMRHLHDITLRILLKLLDYDGKYQPIFYTYLSDDCTVDWVQENLSWEKLGYKIKD